MEGQHVRTIKPSRNKEVRPQRQRKASHKSAEGQSQNKLLTQKSPQTHSQKRASDQTKNREKEKDQAEWEKEQKGTHTLPSRQQPPKAAHLCPSRHNTGGTDSLLKTLAGIQASPRNLPHLEAEKEPRRDDHSQRKWPGEKVLRLTLPKPSPCPILKSKEEAADTEATWPEEAFRLDPHVCKKNPGRVKGEATNHCATRKETL